MGLRAWRIALVPFTALGIAATLWSGPAGSAEAVRARDVGGTSPAGAPALEQLIGQKLIVSMQGKTPSQSLLGRARRGEVGGVLIHEWNFTTTAQLRAITQKLQRAASAGGQPPLLLAVDQEGGSVKTVATIPPTLSPPEMGVRGSTATARAQGRATGVALRTLGLNIDFAPVADVPLSHASFIYRQGRSWSFNASTTTSLTNAFAAGLGDGHVLATMKHFPGLGRATRTTDAYVVHVRASKSVLESGLAPYRLAVTNKVPLIMLSNAIYDAYDSHNAAGWSRAIGTTLLRGQLGFRGVTITDSLDGAAHARNIPTNPLAIRAAQAGTDLILLTGSEAASISVYQSLVRAAENGQLDRAGLLASYQRVLALKNSL